MKHILKHCFETNQMDQWRFLLFVVFLYSGFRSSLSPLHRFIKMFAIISVHCDVSQMRLQILARNEHIFVIWSCISVKGEAYYENMPIQI